MCGGLCCGFRRKGGGGGVGAVLKWLDKKL